MSSHLNHLSTHLSPLFRSTVPHAFTNMTAMSAVAEECRIGSKDPEKKGNNAFSGVTAVADFCAHSHRDSNNMDGGLTMVSWRLKIYIYIYMYACRKF